MENFGKIVRLLFHCIFYLKPCVHFYVSYVYSIIILSESQIKNRKRFVLFRIRKIKISNIIQALFICIIQSNVRCCCHLLSCQRPSSKNLASYRTGGTSAGDFKKCIYLLHIEIIIINERRTIILFSAAAAAAGWYAETLFHSEISILLYFFQVS